ncbi:MAG: alpha/beta fold hydrolase [Planctomyces sp.]|jgi:esterase/lipase superfamily enzyme
MLLSLLLLIVSGCSDRSSSMPLSSDGSQQSATGNDGENDEGGSGVSSVPEVGAPAPETAVSETDPVGSAETDAPPSSYSHGGAIAKDGPPGKPASPRKKRDGAPRSEDSLNPAPSGTTVEDTANGVHDAESPVAMAEPESESGGEQDDAAISQVDAAPGPVAVIRRPGPRTERHGYSIERVYFATNRRPNETPRATTDPDEFFGSERGDMRYGVCEVSIPYRRQPGTLPEPSVMKLEFHQDPAKHVVLMQISLPGEASFWKQLKAAVAASEQRQLMVFVHGYSASFRDAGRRTAQIAYDMNYQGPAFFFSWPAGSSSEGLNRWNYVNDLRRADDSREDLIAVLEKIAAVCEARQIHLVAHSMGNHLLTESLKTMADRNSLASADNPLFDALAMAAPDVDAREFVARTAERIRSFSRRFTVYASEHDKALQFSGQLNGWEPLGLISPTTLKVAGVERFQLVDASALSDAWFDTGHIYYGDMPEVIRDFHQFFQGVPLAQRRLRSVPPVFRLIRHTTLPNPD